ncbi:excinuclease ABC subunit C [Hoylesella oralis CC98A]|nr:excinuclease ABC subunit C [Hoylesella oralis CC98A]
MPEKPGSYQFYDENHHIIYVGKAKRLKTRVSSYFHKEVDRFKTKVLVSRIYDISYTVVNTEEDALLLENSLIKKYNPRYNVLLKDGKTYPSICITNEYLPRIFKTRTINKRFGTYYGPYSNLSSMNAVLNLINKLYKPRTCRFPITREGIANHKYKACLEYHIHNCNAPCIGKQSYEEYQENIKQAREILKGNTREVSNYIFKLMQEKAAELKFEEAEALKQRYTLIENFVAKSEVVSHSINDVDVFTIVDDDLKNNAYINYIHVKNGTINQSFTFEYKRKLDENNKELLITAIPEIRERFKSTAKEIIVPFEMEWKIKDATFFIPQRGDKKHLLELSEMNGKQYKFDRLKRSEKLNPEQKQTRLMKELQEKLNLPKLPYQIECFDNSNISGTDAVAGCIVFKGMKPSKKDYRKYNIKTVDGPNDYASMKEVVRRRYNRMKEEGTPLPDLIITDGGKGQMEVVREVVEDELGLQIPIAGLAKDDHHRTNELLFGFPPQVIGLKTDSELFHSLTRIQDEVHRFAITFHRDKRSKHALHSELDDIKGIGTKTKETLIKAFKTAKKVKATDIQGLTKEIGALKAKIIYNHFHPEKYIKK